MSPKCYYGFIVFQMLLCTEHDDANMDTPPNLATVILQLESMQMQILSLNKPLDLKIRTKTTCFHMIQYEEYALPVAT